MSVTKSRPYYNLMLIMKKKGITQSQLASKLKMNYTSLNNKLLGKYSMKLEEAKDIAKVLNIKLDDID